MADSNETIIRLLQILEKTDEKSPLNAPQIIEIMQNRYRQTMGRDTVYRGIQTLQFCGYPITQCVNRRQGWYFAKRDFEDWQLKIMCDLIMQAKCISSEESEKICRKLLSMTSRRSERKIRNISSTKATTAAGSESIGEYVDLMMEAIFTKKKIMYQYTEYDQSMEPVLSKNGKFYELSIYSMYWDDGVYYVIGGHEKNKENYELTHYRLDRMEKLQISKETMIPIKDFLGSFPEHKLQKYISRQVRHDSGAEVRLVLEFDYDTKTMAALADFAGKDIKITQLKDGKMQAAMIKMDSEALRGWLMLNIKKFEVVKPEWMRETLAEIMRKGIEVYGTD